MHVRSRLRHSVPECATAGHATLATARPAPAASLPHMSTTAFATIPALAASTPAPPTTPNFTATLAATLAATAAHATLLAAAAAAAAAAKASSSTAAGATTAFRAAAAVKSARLASVNVPRLSAFCAAISR